jgi:uncharacterized protein (TIGR00255 family)
MTGFGRGSAQRQDLIVSSEIRSVNNRYLELSFRTSRSLNGFENRAKEILRKHLNRGRIFINLNDLSPRIRMGEVKLDSDITSSLYQHLADIKRGLDLKGDITLDHILNFSDEIREEFINDIPGELFDVAEESLLLALEKLKNMRQREGEALAEDLMQRLGSIEKGVEKAQLLTSGNAEKRLEKLKERLTMIIGTQDLDQQRVEMEMAIIADKYDITEELVRLKSHCKQFHKIMKSGSPCGRRMDFLMQEMNRELNTASSKADIAEMSHLVVELKEELERMREQSQNVE